MSINIKSLAKLTCEGKFCQAAAAASQHCLRFGSDMEGCRALARLASAYGDTRLLSLAWALCPEASGPRAAAFMAGLSDHQAIFCIKNALEMAKLAFEQASEAQLAEERRLATLEARREAAQRASEVAKARLSKKDLARPVAVIERKRMARKIDWSALRETRPGSTDMT